MNARVAGALPLLIMDSIFELLGGDDDTKEAKEETPGPAGGDYDKPDDLGLSVVGDDVESVEKAIS